MDILDPYSVENLLITHGIMTRGLVEKPGVFRSRSVDVVDQEGHVFHFGTLPQYMLGLMEEFLGWTKIATSICSFIAVCFTMSWN